MTPYDPPILMQNPFLHKKWGCLQKTRALYGDSSSNGNATAKRRVANDDF